MRCWLGEIERFALFLKGRDVGVVLDESARIKNPEAKLTQSLFRLALLFKRRIIMTGTPVANRPYDLWAQIWFLDQGASLGNDFLAFKRQTDLTAKLGKSAELQEDFEEALTKTYRKISSFSVRETKNSGLIELPEKKIEAVLVEWEPVQLELYQDIRDQMRAIVVREGLPSEEEAEVVLKRLVRLVQIASNPRLVDEAYVGCPGSSRSCLTSCKRSGMTERNASSGLLSLRTSIGLPGELRRFGSRKIHGQMVMDQRDRSIHAFLKDETVGVLVATPGAAKEGLTLTVANHVIFYDRTFSLDDYLQAQDRIHRISQEKTCFIHNLILPDSIDVWVDVLLRAKQLAAQLAQGDIGIEQYRSEMPYSFAQVLQGVLESPTKIKWLR